MNEIQDEVAKEFLLKAETSMKQNEYTEVVFYATAGLEVMLKKANDFFFNDSSFDFDPFRQDLREVRNLGNLLNETVICYSLNINIEQYVRYRKMAGYFRIAGEQPVQKGGMFSHIRSVFTKKNAEVSLDYCTKTIIEIEKTLERLNKPLGEE
jgi:hypothetical protein